MVLSLYPPYWEHKLQLLLTDLNSEKLCAQASCDDLIDIEEAILGFLNDNIGDDETFRPACAYVDANAISTSTGRDDEGRIISTTALRVEVVYTTTEEFRLEIEDRFAEIHTKQKGMNGRKGEGVLRNNQNHRNLQRRQTCDTSNHHLCCSQQSINADVGDFCRVLGCDFGNCGGRALGARPPGGGGGSFSRPVRPPERPDQPGVGGGGPTNGTPTRPNQPGGGGVGLAEGTSTRPNRPKR